MVEVDRDAFRTGVSRTLTKLNHALAAEVGPEDTDQVREYIEHHEFGLALDLIIASIIHQALDGRPFEADIDSLARAMRMQDSHHVLEWRKYLGGA